MQAPSDIQPGYTLQPRLRVFEGERMVLGWGKIMLLRRVRETGTIGEAARRMGISYNHAWSLIRLMNSAFREPLVEAVRGGHGKGGATLTDAGVAVLRLYQEMTDESVRATRHQWRALRRMLRPPGPGRE